MKSDLERESWQRWNGLTCFFSFCWGVFWFQLRCRETRTYELYEPHEFWSSEIFRPLCLWLSAHDVYFFLSLFSFSFPPLFFVTLSTSDPYRFSSINCEGARTSAWRVFVLHVCILQKPCRRYHPCWPFVAANYSSLVLSGWKVAFLEWSHPGCPHIKVLAQTGSMHTRPLFLTLCLWCNKPHSPPQFQFQFQYNLVTISGGYLIISTILRWVRFSPAFFLVFFFFWLLRYVPHILWGRQSLFSSDFALCQKMVGCFNFYAFIACMSAFWDRLSDHFSLTTTSAVLIDLLISVESISMANQWFASYIFTLSVIVIVIVAIRHLNHQS